MYKNKTHKVSLTKVDQINSNLEDKITLIYRVYLFEGKSHSYTFAYNDYYKRTRNVCFFIHNTDILNFYTPSTPKSKLLFFNSTIEI